MSASKSIPIFFHHPVAFALQASLPSDKINLNPAKMNTHQNVSDFQTGIDAAVHAPLDYE